MADGTFKILYFAEARNYSKRDSEMLPAPLPLSNLFDTLEGKYPGIKEAVLTTSMVSVNLSYMDLEEEDAGRVLVAGDEVAVIPPVSAG
jgi:molybdopterin converting factor small subunit